MTDQPIYLSITPKGERYFQQLVTEGFTKIKPTQRIEWDILHDLVLSGEEVRMDNFLAEGRSSILGRTFSRLSESTHGLPVIEWYGKTLHSLIKQGYVRAFNKEV